VLVAVVVVAMVVGWVMGVWCGAWCVVGGRYRMVGGTGGRLVVEVPMVVIGALLPVSAFLR
jgi:hypothetical protein